MNETIAIVDDEQDIRELVALHLKKSGFKTKLFSKSAEFKAFVLQTIPDLVILDLMLPDTDGLDLCKELKANERLQRVPIVMLTAKGEETDKIIGLELGADDYVTKPFSPKELVARVKAVLRRATNDAPAAITVIEGDKTLTINAEQYQAFLNGVAIDLTATEFKLLLTLTARKGRVFTRDQILTALWGNEKYVIDRTVDVHIRHLRDKLGTAGARIKNVRGVGYKFE